MINKPNIFLLVISLVLFAIIIFFGDINVDIMLGTVGTILLMASFIVGNGR